MADDDGLPMNPCCRKLVEKLEKSEASRKKLRQALSILNEKLDLTEKVLKHNETLRQEYERERQHAEDERKRADEERRHKEMLETDVQTYKEQFAMTTLRLEKVEKNQMLEKKELDLLRDEVKVVVDGVRAAAQAVESLQCSLQKLETSLLAKKTKCSHIQSNTHERSNGKRRSKKSRKGHAINLKKSNADDKRNMLDFAFDISDSEDDWLRNIKLLSPTLPHIAPPVFEPLSIDDICSPTANMGIDTSIYVPVQHELEGKAENVNDIINNGGNLDIISDSDPSRQPKVANVSYLASEVLRSFSGSMQTSDIDIVNRNVDQMASSILDWQQKLPNSVGNFLISALINEEDRNVIENALQQIGVTSGLDFDNVVETNFINLSNTLDSISCESAEAAASLLNKELTELHGVPFLGGAAWESIGEDKSTSSLCQINNISEYWDCKGFSESNEQDATEQVLQHNDIPIRLHDSHHNCSVISLLLGGNLHATLSGRDFISIAAIIAARIKKCFSAEVFDNELAGKLENDLALTTISSKVPREILVCSLISAAVEIAIAEDKLDNNSPEQGPSYHLLHSFIELLQRVTAKGGAIGVIYDMVECIGRFLVEGIITLVTLGESVTSDLDFSSLEDKKEVLHFSSLSSSTASLKEIQIGSMVVASFCQAFSCTSHLQALVYQILRWCNKDAIWLLTIFSSFASICGHASFEAGPSDLLGWTLCVIISELLVRVEAKRAPLNGQIVAASSSEDGSILTIKGIQDLKNSLKKEQSSCLEELVLSLLESLQYILSPGQTAILKSQTSSDGFLSKKTLSSQMLEGKDRVACLLHDMESQESVLKFPQSGVLRTTDEQNVMELIHMPLDWNGWQSKYQEILGAIELIAFYMGWEWTYNKLIVKHLWELMTPSASQGMLVAVIQIIGMCGRMDQSNAGNESPCMDEVRNCLAFFVSPINAFRADASEEYSFPFIVQIAAVNALVCLSAPGSLFEEKWKSVVSSSECSLQSCESETLSPVYANLVQKWFSKIGPHRDKMPTFLRDMLASCLQD